MSIVDGTFDGHFTPWWLLKYRVKNKLHVGFVTGSTPRLLIFILIVLKSSLPESHGMVYTGFGGLELLSQFSTAPLSGIMIPILQMRKMRLRVTRNFG